MPEYKKPLPDIIDFKLNILFIGYNPGIKSTASGHHYAGNSNRFWKLLFDSGLTPDLIRPAQDSSILTFGYGSTNIVDKTTKSASEITPNEMKTGSASLFKLLTRYKPKIACYVGIGIYRSFKANISGIPHNKVIVVPGIQENSTVEGVLDYVCYNPSGLNTIPYEKQLHYFKELKQLISF